MKTVLLLSVLAAARLVAADVLTLERTIPLPGVAGRIDHLAVDEGGNRLFVAALGNGSLEVVDLRTGRVAKSVAGLTEPQGVAVVPEMNRIFVACGDGKLEIFDAGSVTAVGVVSFDDDADNVRYVAGAKRLYVGHGGGALGIVDVVTNRTVGDIAVGGHPEAFELEATGAHGFVNVPGAHIVAIVDLATGKASGKLSLGFAAANYPMALDAMGHRLFVGCRMPARLLVFDTESGREVVKLDLHGDCDDLFFDAKRQLIIATCGAGYVDVFSKTGPDDYAAAGSIQTASGARTGLLAGNILYLAVPKAGERQAEIRIYRLPETKP